MIGVDLSKEEAQVIDHALLTICLCAEFRFPRIVVDVRQLPGGVGKI